MAIIKSKKAFTLIEVVVSMFLFSLILLSSIKAYEYVSRTSQLNEIRYLALNKIDSEMNRLVYSYENVDDSDFASYRGTNAVGLWSDYFFVHDNIGLNEQSMVIYKNHTLAQDNTAGDYFGLNISSGLYLEENVIEIVNNGTISNTIEKGDIVGLLGWKIAYGTNDDVNLSLSITYPYYATSQAETNSFGKSNTKIMPMYNYTETINLKTSTRLKN